MVIIADTREQKMLDFGGIKGVEKVEESGLAYGDYSAIVQDKAVPIVVERKGFSDLWGTMTGGHERFRAEMERAKADNVKIVLAVEGTYTDVWNGFERSAFSGESMLMMLATMYVKYDLEVWFCESRRVMARRIVDTFLAVERTWKSGGCPGTREEGRQTGL